MWLAGRLHIEGRLNEGPRLQWKHEDENEARQNKRNTRERHQRKTSCRLSTLLTTGQPMVEFYLLTLSRFPSRKKEHNFFFDKNRTHDFRTKQYVCEFRNGLWDKKSVVFRNFGGNDHRLRPFTVEVLWPTSVYGQREKKKNYFE